MSLSFKMFTMFVEAVLKNLQYVRGPSLEKKIVKHLKLYIAKAGMKLFFFTLLSCQLHHWNIIMFLRLPAVGDKAA